MFITFGQVRLGCIGYSVAPPGEVTEGICAQMLGKVNTL